MMKGPCVHRIQRGREDHDRDRRRLPEFESGMTATTAQTAHYDTFLGAQIVLRGWEASPRIVDRARSGLS
jgi:hypothetical protein